MDILVCMKQVPDTNVQIKIAADGKDIDRTGVNYVINPYDELALEVAIRTREKMGGTVTLVTIGPDRVTEQIRAALAMGVDKAIHVKDAKLDSADHFQIAKVLAAVAKKNPHQVILCGKQAVDDYAFIVGPALAEYLGYPHVTFAKKVEFDADGAGATIEREAEAEMEVIECPLPAVITVEKGVNGINDPRYPALPDILKAKKKEIQVLNLQELGMRNEELGESRVVVEKYTTPAPKAAGKVLKGEPAEVVPQLIKLLKDEAKVL